MPLTNLQPTNFQSPDAVLGGNAVTTPSNTGHALSDVNAGAFGPSSDSESCRWHTFQSAPYAQIAKITLKFDHTSSGSLTGAGAANSFTVSYTLNGGGAWINAVARVNFAAPQGPTTFSVDLPNDQDVSQVQVRDIAVASVLNVETEAASVTFTVSDIKIEVTTVDAMPILMM